MPKPKPKPKKRKPAAPARKPAPNVGNVSEPSPASRFAAAVELASRDFFFDAVAAFRSFAKEDPKGDLADDAIYNAGLCLFRLGRYDEALAHFERVAKEYPRAKIRAVAGAQEFGRTAGKAHLGRLRCLLALGRREQAQATLDALNAYPDSYVIDDQGRKRTYYELGIEALQ